MVSSKNFIFTAALAAAAAAIPFPEALAQLPGATMECHSVCGTLILEARKCGDTCCDKGSAFMDLVPGCLDCGWQLWNYYGKYLVEPLGKCGLPTEPTGVNTNTIAQTTAAVETSKPAETTAAPETSAPAESSSPVKSSAPAESSPSIGTSTHESSSMHATSTHESSSMHATSAHESSSMHATSSHAISSTVSGISSTLAASSAPVSTSEAVSSTLTQVNGVSGVAVPGAIAVVAGIVAGLF
ncbi:hypothetical protein D0Z03_002875 [Geotrichum reessii]|nr:hypothetical protein D0Z03_002875 [Galactomyces reessii]